MRFRLNRGSYFQARDQFGNPYAKKWRTLTTGKCRDNRSTLTFAMNEAISMYLFNKVGVPASDTHWIHWRVIDQPAEAPDQWRGDFQGLSFVMETYDVRFPEAHDLAKGNHHQDVIHRLYDSLGKWGRRMAQRVTRSDDEIVRMRGGSQRKGILPFLVDGSEVPDELTSKYRGLAPGNFMDN